jgi:hypothetical protein
MKSRRRTFIVAIAGAVLLAGCGASNGGTATTRSIDARPSSTTAPGLDRAEAIAEIEAALATWQAAGIDDYSYTIERHCLCPAELHARVFVEAGEVATVELLAEGGDTEFARERMRMTMGEVLAELLAILRAGDEEPGPIELVFDPDLGFPTEVDVDPIRDAIDDEFGFSIVDFVPGEGEAPEALDPAHQSTTVTVEEIEFDVPDSLDGLVLGGVLEGTFDDGAAGAVPVVLTTRGDEATLIRGRWCGTWWGPAPRSDGLGGVVVSTDEPSLVRCSPGETVHTVGTGMTQLGVGIVGDRPVVVAIEWGAPEPVTVDLVTGESSTFFPAQGELVGASYGGGRWLLTSIGSGVELALFDTSGSPIPALMPSGTSRRWPAVIDDSGTRIAWIEQGEEPIEPGGPPVQLVVWDVVAGRETHRLEVEVADGLRAGVGEIDLRGSRVILGVYGHDAEEYPARALLVDIDDGSAVPIDLGIPNLTIVMATFVSDWRG